MFVVSVLLYPQTAPQSCLVCLCVFWVKDDSLNVFLFCQGRWQSQMQQLRDMGIQDEELMLRALQATDGDIQAALELIFAGGPGL